MALSTKMQTFQFATKLGQGNRYLTLSKWNGEYRVDIREWDATGTIPSKKGISLPLQEWKMLCLVAADINQARKDMILKVESGIIYFKPDVKLTRCLHIGGQIFVKAETGFPCIDIRKFWLPDGELEQKPTRKGISLRQEEWDDALNCEEKMDRLYPEIGETVVNFDCHNHNSQLDMLRCIVCTPQAANQWLN